MKKILFLLFSLLFCNFYSQTGPPTIDPNNCMTDLNLYTSTTDPNNNSSQFSYYNLNPNYGSTYFDWVNTQYLTVYAQTNGQGIVTAPSTFISPFYCGGNCSDNNTSMYNNIYQDIYGQYSNNMAAKLKAMDILPEDGWELFKYKFGRAVNTNISNLDPGVAEPNPFIWLYNRFTGKMKLFIAITNVNLNTGLAQREASF